MVIKNYTKLFCLLLIAFMFPITAPVYAQFQTERKEVQAVKDFLNSLEYTTRIRYEYDDNILLVPDGKDADTAEIFTQSIKQKLSGEKQYFEWGYTGNYSYYNDMESDIFGHTANALYSYRPNEKWSIGFSNTFYWLADSSISSSIGDRVLALGYNQINPGAQIKYELNEKARFTTDFNFSKLDVDNESNDDFIDNKKTSVMGKIDYDLLDDLIGYGGFGFQYVTFPQIVEKSAATDRGFLGLTKKLNGLMDLTGEVGFSQIEMDDNADDDNTDFKLALDTKFSLYTKLSVSYQNQYKNPSLRREYTQYDSNLASVILYHTINTDTSINLNYSYEKQNFNLPDALVGQLALDRETSINTLGVGLNRKLNSLVTLEFNYTYTDRDSDFANESYVDNRVGLGLTARY